MAVPYSCGDSQDFREPVNVVPGGMELEPEADLRLLMALLDSRYWPLQICGDNNIGNIDWNNAVGVSPNQYDHTAIDDGPITDGGGFPRPEDYPFPGVGVSAHACQLGCNYLIVGDLGADVIIGKIDDQWHIL